MFNFNIMYFIVDIFSILGDENWCDHWKQCVWLTHGTGIPVSKDKHVLFKAVHNDTSISYCLKFDDQSAYNDFNSANCLIMLLPEKIALYGDKDWRLALIRTIKNAVRICFHLWRLLYSGRSFSGSCLGSWCMFYVIT